MNTREKLIKELTSGSEHEEVNSAVHSLTREDLSDNWAKGTVKGARRANRVAVTCFTVILILFSVMVYLGVFNAQKLNSFTNSLYAIQPAEKLLTLSKKPFSEEEKTILWGDNSAVNEALQWKALHELDPTKPEYFINYAAFKIEEDGHLSPEDQAFIERYDPSNGIYDLFLIGVDFDNVIQKVTPKNFQRKTANPDAPRPRDQNKILDQAKYEEYLRLLKKAYQRGESRNYSEILMVERDGIIGSSNDYQEMMFRVSTFSTYNPHCVAYLTTSHLLCVASSEAEKASDWKELEELWNISM